MSNNDKSTKSVMSVLKDHYADLFGLFKNEMIRLCPYCEGRGFTTETYLRNYHNNDLVTKSHKCILCEGSGRIKIHLELSDVKSYIVPYNVREESKKYE